MQDAVAEENAKERDEGEKRGLLYEREGGEAWSGREKEGVEGGGAL